MMRNHGKIAMLAAGLISLAALGGCNTSQPGVTETLGRYDTTIQAPPARVTRAATDVLQDDYKFKLESSSLSTIDGEVQAETAQGTKVQIWVNKEGDNASRIYVRVGMTGDEELSQEILNKVRERSKTLMEKIRGTASEHE